MKNWIYIVVLMISFLACDSAKNESTKTELVTQPLNTKLMAVLDSMGHLDQLHRSAMGDLADKYGWNSPQMDSLWTLQRKIDGRNILLLEEIIEQYGFPGRSLVGEGGSRNAFLILQHSGSETMDKYYELVVKAGENNELAMNRVAMFQDRVLMNRGEKQIYGTQIRSERLTNPETGETYDSSYVWPIENPAEVNERRLSVGLDTPIEEYAAGFGVIY